MSAPNITEAELDALTEHFKNYTSGPGHDVLRAVAALHYYKERCELLLGELKAERAAGAK